MKVRWNKTDLVGAETAWILRSSWVIAGSSLVY